jgi:hypothetical protein
MVKSRRMRWEGHVTRMEMSNACRLLVGKPEGERPLEVQDVGRWVMLRWMLERENGGDVDWIDLAWDRDQCRALVKAAKNLPDP